MEEGQLTGHVAPAEMPDLWDVNVGTGADMLTSRFRKEAWQEDTIGFVRAATSKPVVGVGRFTIPDTMASMLRRGAVDLVSAARDPPSPILSCPGKSRRGALRTFASVSAAITVWPQTSADSAARGRQSRAA